MGRITDLSRVWHKKYTLTGHEDATEDVGIYEFVSIPGKMESTQVFDMLYTYMKYICTVSNKLAKNCGFNFPTRHVFPGVMQIPLSPRVYSGYAHHHLRCDQTCSWNPQSQFAQVTTSWKVEIQLKVVSLENFCVALFSQVSVLSKKLKLWVWWPNFFAQGKRETHWSTQSDRALFYCWESGTCIKCLLLI